MGHETAAARWGGVWQLGVQVVAARLAVRRAGGRRTGRQSLTKVAHAVAAAAAAGGVEECGSWDCREWLWVCAVQGRGQTW